MLLAEILCIWVFTTAPAITALQDHPQPDSLLLSRLDRLESLLADHQAQFQRDRARWESLTHTLGAENQGLKNELGNLQRQLASMDTKQQSLQDHLARCECSPRPDIAAEQSRQAVQTSEHQGDSRKAKDPSPQHPKDLNSVQYLNHTDPFKQHVQSARSDDSGPLEAVTNHLAQQMTEVTADVQALKTSVAQQHQDIQAARGSTFVHWGSSTCAGSSELAYSGVVGGSHYTHTGAAATTLCLSLSPTLENPSSSVTYTLLYGTEYETADSHQDEDAVCAVCRTPQPTTIMVPGTKVCSAGWTLQYSGFLMAGHYTQVAATEFICVDPKLGSVIHSSGNQDGHLLYFTKTQCGSLSCPPYEDSKVVTCAVCSK